jgi:SAM-dependent methyltransferase
MGEVYLWRGTTQQRARRSLEGKLGRFAYFNAQFSYPEWRGKTVLDFGGNEGNLLLDPGCPIRPENYYCVDVIREALREGRKRFPQAHWVHYNRYNCSFNPGGIKGLPIPDIGTRFQIILAYSVFTHTTREDMHELIEELWTRLLPGGVLAFTFIDPHFVPWPENYRGSNLRWRLEKNRESDPGVDVERLWRKGRTADWCALVNGCELYVNGNGVWENESQTCITYDVYHSVEFLRREFPQATIRPPVWGGMQHCCIIRR